MAAPTGFEPADADVTLPPWFFLLAAVVVLTCLILASSPGPSPDPDRPTDPATTTVRP